MGTFKIILCAYTALRLRPLELVFSLKQNKMGTFKIILCAYTALQLRSPELVFGLKQNKMGIFKIILCAYTALRLRSLELVFGLKQNKLGTFKIILCAYTALQLRMCNRRIPKLKKFNYSLMCLFLRKKYPPNLKCQTFCVDKIVDEQSGFNQSIKSSFNIDTSVTNL